MVLKSRVLGKNPAARMSLYVRHGPKESDMHNALLTTAGRLVVQKRSKILPTSEKFLIRTSPIERAMQTAEEIIKIRPGKITKVGLLSADRLVLDKEKFDAYFRSGKKWANFMRDWLDGNLSSFTINPDIVASGVIKSLEHKHKPKERISVNITHAMILESILERLTGKKYESLVKLNSLGKKEINPGEGFILYYPNGNKVILEFNKKHYDVTKRYFALVHSNK